MLPKIHRRRKILQASSRQMRLFIDVNSLYIPFIQSESASVACCPPKLMEDNTVESLFR